MKSFAKRGKVIVISDPYRIKSGCSSVRGFGRAADGRTRKNVAPYDRLRTYGIHPIPWSTLHGPLFTLVADNLPEQECRSLIKELGEAGVLVVDGQSLHLPSCGGGYDDVDWSFTTETMLRVVKVSK